MDVDWTIERAQREIADALRMAPASDIQSVARIAAKRLLEKRLLRPLSAE